MSTKLGITKHVEDGSGLSESIILIGGEVDEANEAISFLVFKDTTNGKKYKLQITNGAIELVEVT